MIQRNYISLNTKNIVDIFERVDAIKMETD